VERRAEGAGYINAARSFLEVKTIFRASRWPSTWASAPWASGSARPVEQQRQLETTSVLASYQQVFYTVSMDSDTAVAGVRPTVNVDHVRQVTDSAHPPAYVRSVDYGRILMIKMETSP
jgi:thiol-activated cytolysin